MVVSDKEIFALCDVIRETAFALHRHLRHGHFEKVYENGLSHRLRKKGLQVEQQVPITVVDEDGAVLGEYFADLVINGTIIIELKACKAFTEDHVGQLFDYLRGSRFEHGILINFGAPKLGSRKFAMSEIYAREA
jgi:GxxExxY protein